MAPGAATSAKHGLLAYKVAAFRAGVSVRTLKRWVSEGKVAPAGAGAGRKIVQASLDAYLASQRLAVKSPAIFLQGLADDQNRKALLEFLAPYVDALVDRRLAQGETLRAGAASRAPTNAEEVAA